MERRPEMRRTMTLSEQLSTPDSAIGDFLKIPHDGDGVVSGMINWKPLRDRLRLRRAASAWTTSSSPSPKPAAAASNAGGGGRSQHSNKYNYSPGEAAAAFSRTYSRAPSLRPTPTFSRVTSTRRSAPIIDYNDDDNGDESEQDDDEEEEGKNDEAPAAQMSLMALLEQTDSQWDSDEEEDGHGHGGGGGKKNGGGDGEEEEEEEGEGREEEMVHVCCVCMVRHKGAAFIPCGHTFCRLCSRELWVSRGNCPLCNGFIQEILDIF